jgi:hypothetical protein
MAVVALRKITEVEGRNERREVVQKEKKAGVRLSFLLHIILRDTVHIQMVVIAEYRKSIQKLACP